MWPLIRQRLLNFYCLISRTHKPPQTITGLQAVNFAPVVTQKAMASLIAA